MNKESTLYVVVFSLIVTFALVLPLTVANELTKDLVNQNKRVAQATSILQAMGFPADKTQPEALLARYDALKKYQVKDGALVPVTNEAIAAAAKTITPIQPLVYQGEGPTGPVWAGSFVGPALWGNVTLALGFDAPVQTITGLRVIAQAETPGLGARIADPWFVNQFAGQKVPASGQLRFVNGSGAGDSDKTNETVDGVTGATLTTNGVRDIVNKAIVEMKALIGGNL